MYQITLKGITDEYILKKIYNSIDCFKLYNIVFIIYKLDFSERIPKNLNKIIAHSILIDFNDLEKYKNDEETLEDLILDLIELNRSIIVKEYTGKDLEFKGIIDNIVKDFGFKYIKYENFDFDRPIDWTNLTYNDMQILFEILEIEQNNVQKFYSKDFMIKYEIDNQGNLWYNNKKILNINEDDLINILFHKPEDINDKIKSALHSYNDNNLLSSCWYEPFIFITSDNINVDEEILKYKYRLFDALKNIVPDDYPNIPIEVIKILNENSYIMMNDILEIISNKEGA